MNAQEVIAKADRGEGLTEGKSKSIVLPSNRRSICTESMVLLQRSILKSIMSGSSGQSRICLSTCIISTDRRTSCTKVCMRSCRKMSGIRGREIFWKITAVRRRSGRLLRVRFFLN